MDEKQAEMDVARLDAEEQRLLERVELLREELAAAEVEYERVRDANMRARRAAITGSPVPSDELREHQREDNLPR